MIELLNDLSVIVSFDFCNTFIKKSMYLFNRMIKIIGGGGLNGEKINKNLRSAH
jgi:hypothetical protein